MSVFRTVVTFLWSFLCHIVPILKHIFKVYDHNNSQMNYRVQTRHKLPLLLIFDLEPFLVLYRCEL